MEGQAPTTSDAMMPNSNNNVMMAALRASHPKIRSANMPDMNDLLGGGVVRLMPEADSVVVLWRTGIIVDTLVALRS